MLWKVRSNQVFNILKMTMYAGSAPVYAFHDDRPDMPLMNEDDYYWRNRVEINGKDTSVEVCV
jgi:hypothetical protein